MWNAPRPPPASDVSLSIPKVDSPIVNLIPNSGQAGVVGLKDSESIYHSFDYGQNVNLQVDLLVKYFSRETKAASLPATHNDDATANHAYLQIELLHEWFSHKQTKDYTQEAILKAFETVTAGVIPYTFLTAVGHFVHKIKDQEPRVWSALMARPEDKKIEFIKAIAAVPDLQNRILLMQIDYSLKETKEMTDDMLKRAETMLDALQTKNTRFLKFLAAATSVLISLGSSPTINLSRLVSAFSNYQGTKDSNPWKFLHLYITQEPEARGLHWVADFWMFDREVPQVSEADIVYLKESFGKLASKLRGLSIHHERIATLIKEAETSIARTDKIQEKMRQVAALYACSTTGDESTYDGIRVAITGIRAASITTVEEVLEQLVNFKLDNAWRININKCKANREALQQQPTSLSLSALRRGRPDNISERVPYHEPTSDPANFYKSDITSYHAYTAMLSDYTAAWQTLTGVFTCAGYYGQEYLQHPLPLLITNIEELKRKHHFYDGEKFFADSNLQEYKAALQKLLDNQYDELEMEQKVYLSSLQHDSGFF